MAAVWGMSPLLRENLLASDMEGIRNVEVGGGGQMEEIDTSFTVHWQRDGIIFICVEYEKRR